VHLQPAFYTLGFLPFFCCQQFRFCVAAVSVKKDEKEGVAVFCFTVE
jgi:hypothetical protein